MASNLTRSEHWNPGRARCANANVCHDYCRRLDIHGLDISLKTDTATIRFCPGSDFLLMSSEPARCCSVSARSKGAHFSLSISMQPSHIISKKHPVQRCSSCKVWHPRASCSLSILASGTAMVLQETGGTYGVALGEKHMEDLVMGHAPPPPSRAADSAASLVSCPPWPCWQCNQSCRYAETFTVLVCVSLLREG